MRKKLQDILVGVEVVETMVLLEWMTNLSDIKDEETKRSFQETLQQEKKVKSAHSRSETMPKLEESLSQVEWSWQKSSESENDCQN